MPDYMLDTDTVSLALRGEGNVGQEILKHRPSELSISSVTLAELRFGAQVKGSQKLHRLISTFADSIDVIPFDQAAATEYGIVAASLRKSGTPIGSLDTLLAAHALSLDLIFVTANQKHFKMVTGLTIENWK
jgi:tRNA(fMet)-specific endonuclease VapC